MPLKGRHKLATQIGNHAFFAEVELEIESSDRPMNPPIKVVYSELNPVTAGVDWKDATAFGIKHAASTLNTDLVGKGLIVAVTHVHGIPGDTGYMELAYAASFALWKAVGHSPTDPPRLDVDTKSIVFPK